MLFDLSFAMRPVRHAVQFCSVINWSLRKKNLANFAVCGSDSVSKFVQNLLLRLKICTSKFARKKT